MKESIHTIPLMDAFKAEDECPFCYLEREAEQHAISFALGSGASYMEDDVRAETDATISGCATRRRSWQSILTNPSARPSPASRNSPSAPKALRIRPICRSTTTRSSM